MAVRREPASDDTVATVLIIGASRGIGLETVKSALEAGHSVRAMARSAQRIPVNHPDLTNVSADALDQAALKEVLKGVDAVIQTLGVSSSVERAIKPTSLFSEATRLLIQAMKQTGVKRLIAVTGFGAGDSRNRGGCLYSFAFHLFLGRVYADKDEQEDVIQDSGLDWVIVRPVILTSGSRTGRYHVRVEPRSWRIGFISRADVADFLVKQITDDAYLGKTPVLTG
jgi:putative NADH-flavin reductase